MEELLFDKPKWMFQSIFSKEYVEKHQYDNIDKFLDESPQIFWINESKNAIVSNKSCGWMIGGRIKAISNRECYYNFGIESMEESKNRCYSRNP